MRILLCVNCDFMSNIALNRLRPALARHEFEIAQSRAPAKSSTPKARAFVEWQSFERTLIEEQLYPLIESRGDTRYFHSFAQLARDSTSGKLHEFASINRDDGL